MKKAVVDAIKVLERVNVTKSKVCINEKVVCLIYENLCASNKEWNLRELLRFSNRMTEDRSELWIIRTLTRFVLAGNNVELLLTLVEPFCPTSFQYCSTEEWNMTSMNVTKDAKSTWCRKRNKRAFDPQELMVLFNNFVCDQEIIVSLAEFYEEKYTSLGYSRVWTMKNYAVLWCCLAENLADLFNSTPDKI